MASSKKQPADAAYWARMFCNAVELTARLPMLRRLHSLPEGFAAKAEADPIPELIFRSDALIVPVDPRVCLIPGACLFITLPEEWRDQALLADLLLEIAQQSARTAEVLRGELSRETEALLRRAGLRIFSQSEIEPGFGCYDASREVSDETRLRTMAAGVIGLRRWIEAHGPIEFVEELCGLKLREALGLMGATPTHPFAARLKTLEDLTDELASELPPLEKASRALAYEELLHFGLSPVPKVEASPLLLLPESAPSVYRGRGRRGAPQLLSDNDRADGEAILEKALAWIEKQQGAIERGEYDYETNERRTRTDWEKLAESFGSPRARLASYALTPKSEDPAADYSESDVLRLDRWPGAFLKGAAVFTLPAAPLSEDDVEEAQEAGGEAERAPSESGSQASDELRTVSGDIDAYTFVRALLSMPRWIAKDAPEAAVAWRAAIRAAATLLAAGCLAPKPYLTPGHALALAWTPNLLIPEVRALMGRFASLLEPCLDEAFPKGELAPGKRKPERAAIRAIAVAASAILWNKDLHKGWYQGQGRIVSAPLATDPALVRSYAGALPKLIASYREALLAGSLAERPVLQVENLGNGTVRAAFGFSPKTSSPLAGPFTPIAAVRREPARWPKLSLQADEALKAYAKSYPTLARIAKGKTGDVVLTVEDLADFLFREVPTYGLAGIAVRLPDELVHFIEPVLVAVVDAGETLSTKGLLDRRSLADFRWELAVGEQRLPLSELRRLIDNAGKIVSYGRAFLYFTQQKADEIEAQLSASKRISNWDKLRAILMGAFAGVRVEASAPVREKLAALVNVRELAPPPGLLASLRPYQKRGFSWLMKNLRLGLGALIADDMGLGKTVQVIAALLQLKAEGELGAAAGKGSAIVVVPASLMTNWLRELERFAPSLSVMIYHGPNRILPAQSALPDVVVTSYRIAANDLEEINARRWRLLVIDEAQAIKNSGTAQAKAVKLIGAPQAIAMTGTPVENRLQEYWAIFSAVQPKLFGSLKQFREEFARPIEEARSLAAIERFRRLTAPFTIRRMKTDRDVAAELPERTTIDWFTTLNPAQVALYEDCLKVSLTDLSVLAREAEAAHDEAKMKMVQELKLKRRGHILRMIMHLKQICNSPSQFLKTSAPRPDSGKGEALMQLLSQCEDAGRKALVFTQFAEMGFLLQKWIGARFGAAPDFLHGGASVAQRQAMVDRFQNDPRARVLIISIKAGGFGLNLTAASAVIHYDLWWNPAVEAQATDRAYRIGQRRDVAVYRFVTAGTFEEKLNAMIAKKRELAKLTVSTGESWIGDLSDAEIGEIFRFS